MSSKVRVRFAPSPTGYLHVGGARTALFNWLYAKNQGGDFILRIEDTDQSRYSAEALKDLKDDLKWLGLEWDEGDGVGGPFGPYQQSERLDMYRQAADELLAKDLAYPCFCSAERLDELREKQKAENLATGYDRCCRDMNPAEAQKRIDAGEAHVIRLKVPLDGETSFKDFLRKNISTPNNVLDDMVLLKRDGFPTYHLANVVDDHHMEITHVLRGDEWIPSTSRHILLYQAFGWEAPEYVHLPVILAAGGGKLSKRKGAASVGDYREKGYYPEALFNFLALLGWSPGEDREKMTIEEMIQNFSLERINPKSAAFDEKKLEWLNSQYIQTAPAEKLLPVFKEELEKAGLDISQRSNADLAPVLDAVRERVRLTTEYPQHAAYFFKAPEEYDNKAQKKAWKVDAEKRLEAVLEILENEADFSEKNLEDKIHALIEEKEWGFGPVMMPLRLALCGSLMGPSVYWIMEFLGKDESISRIRQTLPLIVARNADK